MTVSEVVTHYVTHKRSLGMRFNTEARVLKSFCSHVRNVALSQIYPVQVREFLDGSGPVTRFWHCKYTALRGFYRYAIARGHVNASPLPSTAPKVAADFVPYIFTREDLRRLLRATDAHQDPRCLLQPETFRTLLLLLYGAALRISEALSLTVQDVDLEDAVLHIRESKFYKTRLVPICSDLRTVLIEHIRLSRKGHRGSGPSGPRAPLFTVRTGAALTRRAAEAAFCRLRERAGVLRADCATYQPRLHDLRHAAAVHRVIDWYKNGLNVQQLLPQLATYLGHVHICATQRYLTITSDLLQQAGRRFEQYAMGEFHE